MLSEGLDPVKGGPAHVDRADRIVYSLSSNE